MAVSFDGARRLGEVIETSSVSFWAESDRLHDAPALGTFVSVASTSGDTIYAVVSYAETAGIDSTRRAIRRGSEEVRDEAVYTRHPELARILRTVFQAVLVAYRRGPRLLRTLPPLPPPLHYSVERPRRGELLEVTDDPRYLAMLGHYTGDVPREQLIAAHLRHVFEVRNDDQTWLETACRELARIYKNDYDVLLPLLEAVAPDE